MRLLSLKVILLCVAQVSKILRANTEYPLSASPRVNYRGKLVKWLFPLSALSAVGLVHVPPKQ